MLQKGSLDAEITLFSCFFLNDASMYGPSILSDTMKSRKNWWGKLDLGFSDL